MDATLGYRRGDLVEVKSLSEILGTLDADGKLDGLLFMPEMAQYCGQRFRVYRRATKTCVEGAGVRRMERAVLLEGLRCDGAAHEGCQRACLLFWKEAWLNPCDGATPAVASGDGSEPQGAKDGRDACLAKLPTRKDDRFYCQSTELSGATREMPGGNLHHFFRDFLAGDLTFVELSRSLWQKGVNRLRRRFGHGLYKHLAGREANPRQGRSQPPAGRMGRSQERRRDRLAPGPRGQEPGARVRDGDARLLRTPLSGGLRHPADHRRRGREEEAGAR